ncbi:hypothetical protein [Streptomyces sp. NBC_01565]|uniref:hypothetical protein n=1 Tax=unclassified Streptomyces TaxID=2593676 RepID=UPI00224FA1F5|nr:hypothetical protein [Streptomyces sp. NBC_01565]MCX4539542.1 hypothetical protein [Streptomyces sp. NBC_01565]
MTPPARIDVHARLWTAEYLDRPERLGIGIPRLVVRGCGHLAPRLVVPLLAAAATGRGRGGRSVGARPLT